MSRILFLLACLVAVAFGKGHKYHVLHTNPVDESQPTMTFDELRELVSTETREEIGGENVQDDKEVVVISPEQILRLFLRNPSNETEQIFFRDLLPSNSLVMNFHVRNRGFYSSEEKATFSEVEKHFLDVDNPEKRSSVILGKIHGDSDPDNIRWLDPEESAALEDYQDQDWRDVIAQDLGMVVRVAPGDVFSILIGFREVIPPQAEATKDLYKTHLTVHMGQRANAEEGLIESPNYPFNYPDNADIKWLIRSPPNRDFGINIKIMEMVTESCCDRLYIYDGIDTHAPVLGLISGNLDNQTYDFTSTGADVLIEFRSDCLINVGYFSIYFTTVRFPLLPECSGGEIIDSREGYITSSNYPIDYPEQAHCTWLIVAPRETTIDLEIIDFNLDDRDHVRVYDVFKDGAVPIADLAGNEDPHLVIHGSSDRMFLAFDSANHIISRRGFNFYYTTVPIPKACENGLTLDQDEGELTSINYPGNYEVNLVCTWQIRVTEGDIVFIDVADFNTEEYYDVLYIYDGPDSSYRQIAGLSGSNGIERGFPTTTNVAFLKFESDYSNTDSGFRVTWKAYTTSSECDGTTQQLNGDVGYLTSPRYPYPFPSFVDCHWLINTDEFTVAQLNIFDVNLGLESDNHLVIYDGPSSSDRVLFNGTHLPRPHALLINATQNQVYVTLHTVDNFEERGIFIEWAQYDLASTCSETSLLDGPQGLLESPLYPGYYAPGYTCSYYIETPLRTKVQLLKKEFQLAGLDSLKAYDGDSDKADLLFNCSVESCNLKPASRNRMYLVFTAKNSDQGFSFNYYGSSDSCSGSKHADEEATEGFITSVGFPTNYANDLSCEWTITGLPREIIEIRVDGLYTEACCDYLRIYDGDTTSDPEIASLSGAHTDETVETSDNKALITFNSDYSVTYPGFTLHYEGFRPKDDYDFSGSGEAYTCSGYNEMTDDRNDTVGYFVSPGYVNDYPNDLDYCWFLSFPSYFQLIELTFSRVQLEEFFDIVQIYEGQSLLPEQLVAEVTGTIVSITFDVHYHSTTILFHTDESVTDKGFILEYKGML